MLRPITTQALEAVLAALAHYPEGARIEQIEQRLTATSSRRSLQRWLKALIAQGQVLRSGQGRAVVYLRRVVVEARFHAVGTSRAVAYGEAAIVHIQRFAHTLIEGADRNRFIEAVETQLLSLHEGNIARYRIRPSAYHAWRAIWN